VTGFNMTMSQKLRNVRRNGRAALAVDDIASADPWRVRFLEIRGTADAIPAPGRSANLSGEALIRIHPTRILSFGIEEPPREPHLTRLRTPPESPSLNRPWPAYAITRARDGRISA